MFKSIFDVFSKILPTKVTLKFIEIMAKNKKGSYYLYKFYLANKKKNNEIIEVYFNNKYPTRTKGIKNKTTSSIKNKALDPYLNDMYQKFSKYLKSEDSEAIDFYLNKINIYYPHSSLLKKAYLERAIYNGDCLNEIEEAMKTLIELIEKNKEHDFLLKYFKSTLLDKNINHYYDALIYFYYKNPRNHKIMTLLGDMAKSSNDYTKAENFYFLLKSESFFYGSAKLISLYTDWGLYNKAEDLIESICSQNIPEEEGHRIIPMLLRVSSFYPDREAQIFAKRDLLAKSIISSKKNTYKNIRTIIRTRYIPAFPLLKQLDNAKENFTIYSEALLDVIQVAYDNDQINDEVIRCLYQGKVYNESISNLLDKNNVIEFFIPTVFFNLDFNKEIYTTIRNVFNSLIIALNKMDYILIPKMQYNWRYARPNKNFITFCYHTLLSEDQKGIVIQESTLTNRVSFDTKGYAGFSDFASSYSNNDKELPLEILSLINSYTQEFKLNRVSKYKQEEETISITNNYIFFPLQVETDAVSSLRHFDLQTAIKLVSDFAKEKGLVLVLKKHPYCKSSAINKLIEQLTRQEHVVSSNASVHALIESSEFVITANSGVGLEAIFYAKPVVIFGGSDYQSAVFESKTPEEFVDNLNNALETKEIDYSDFIASYLTEYTANAENIDEVSTCLTKQLVKLSQRNNHG